MAKAFAAVAACCACAIGAGWNAIGLRDQVNPAHPVAGLEVADTHASASLLGQFRTSTSSWLWLRTDLYLHNGVELRPLTEDELKAGKTGVGSAEKDLGKAMNDDAVVTSIPSPDRDIRGWLGDLERDTAPYRDMHNHTHNDPEQALPLFRLMTWIDPNFIDGWTVGSTVIARDQSEKGTDKALAFLNEGLANNPESVSVLDSIAFIEITRKKDLPKALEYLEQARKAGLANLKQLPEEEKEEFAQVYRWLALCYRDLTESDKMDAVLREGRQIFPDDAVLAMLSNAPPSVLSEKGRARWEQLQSERAAQRVKGGQADHEMH